MRIVGGSLRGRSLAVPKSNAIRPTTDRTRESLFNILSHNWPEKLNGGRVLDVFAGTGALGLEAMSRGASFAMFVENSIEGRGLLRTNIENFGLNGKTKISKTDATRPGPIRALEPFDLIFADPPYGKTLGEQALAALLREGWLASHALVVLEERKDTLPSALQGFNSIESRNFGETAIGFFELQA
ncbi:16S rRNA (guanine(966)-N(2))-methyltransferase RsmD [Pseudahrensia aquimaris]|uniref:16S rRNA (Guanine(966)-N(2))-methyltransferase RsmD n=1 Tax=Pseudahrensia aquimaris TaxID=744461 RepID=A0ABW3FIE8_9HYPH